MTRHTIRGSSRALKLFLTGTETLALMRPGMNDCGEIVFSLGTTPQGADTEIYLYDNGYREQLTANAVTDVDADTNNAGTVVWSRGRDGFGVATRGVSMLSVSTRSMVD